MENIGTYHLGDNPQLYEPSRTNNFEFVVTGLNGIPRIGDEENGLVNAEEVLRFAVSSSAVPHFEQTAIEVRRGNNSLKYAGVVTFPAGQFNFRNYMGAEIVEILLSWRNLSYNVETERVGVLARTNYKKLGYLIETAPDGEVIRTWRMHGCWISNITQDEFNSESNNVSQLNVTIQYDKAVLDTTDRFAT